MDLKEFAKSQNFGSEKNFQNEENHAKVEAENLYNKYKDYSKSDLTKEIEKLIKTQKNSGTFNKSALFQTLQNFSAFIPSANMEEIKGLIDKIDAEN